MGQKIVQGNLRIDSTTNQSNPLDLVYDNSNEYAIKLYPNTSDLSKIYRIDVADSNAGPLDLSLPSASGTLALISDIPAKTSDLTNDSGFVTSSGVTSVGLSLPNIFTVSSSPVTSTGTLTATLASVAAGNLVFAGPSDGTAGQPSFRALVANDIPSLSASKITSGTFADTRIASASTWNAKSTVSASSSEVSGATEAKSITIDGTSYNLAGGSSPEIIDLRG